MQEKTLTNILLETGSDEQKEKNHGRRYGKHKRPSQNTSVYSRIQAFTQCPALQRKKLKLTCKSTLLSQYSLNCVCVCGGVYLSRLRSFKPKQMVSILEPQEENVSTSIHGHFLKEKYPQALWYNAPPQKKKREREIEPQKHCPEILLNHCLE